jgi:hypothetical protein
MTFPENPWWSVSGQGSVSPLEGASTTLTAYMSPGIATVTLNVRDVSIPTYFNVIPPAEIHPTAEVDIYLPLPSGNAEIGASTQFKYIVLPASANFGNVDFQENVPAGSRLWPDGETTYISPQINEYPPLGCGSVYTDLISDGPYPITRLIGPGGVMSGISFTQTKAEQYKNQSGQWTTFGNTETITTFHSDRSCLEQYQGMSGSSQGPWQ